MISLLSYKNMTDKETIKELKMMLGISDAQTNLYEVEFTGFPKVNLPEDDGAIEKYLGYRVVKAQVYGAERGADLFLTYRIDRDWRLYQYFYKMFKEQLPVDKCKVSVFPSSEEASRQKPALIFNYENLKVDFMGPLKFSYARDEDGVMEIEICFRYEKMEPVFINEFEFQKTED